MPDYFLPQNLRADQNINGRVMVGEFPAAGGVSACSVLGGDDKDKIQHWLISTSGKYLKVSFMVCKMF